MWGVRERPRVNNTILHRALVAGCTGSCLKIRTIAKAISATAERPAGHHGRGSLPVLVYCSPGIKVSSDMLPASPAIARARRPPDNLHLLLTLGCRQLRNACVHSAALHGHAPTTPTCWRHGPPCWPCRQRFRSLRARPWQSVDLPQAPTFAGREAPASRSSTEILCAWMAGALAAPPGLG